MVHVKSSEGLLDPRLRRSCRGSGSHEKVKINDIHALVHVKSSDWLQESGFRRSYPDSDPHERVKIIYRQTKTPTFKISRGFYLSLSIPIIYYTLFTLSSYCFVKSKSLLVNN